MLQALRAGETEPDVEQYEMRFREHAAVQSRVDFFMVDPRKLKIDADYNVRDVNSKETREHIAALKSSIMANGVKVPLEVRLGERDQLYIVAGHCRHAAVMEAIQDGADIAAIPCIPEGKGTSEIDRTVNLIVSNSGKPLSPLEVAAVVKRLIIFGHTEKQIAERLGWKSANTVKQHLDMLALPEGVKQHVREGNVSATTARNISKNADPIEAERLIRENLEENKRIRGSKKRSTKVTARTIKRDAPKREPVVIEVHNEQHTQTPAVVEAVTTLRDQPAQTATADLPATKFLHAAVTTRDIDAFVELTKQSHLVLQHNQSDDHPGWWTPALVEAIRSARDIIERLTGKPMEFETLADSLSQEEAA